jgi:hypothetical protein
MDVSQGLGIHRSEESLASDVPSLASEPVSLAYITILPLLLRMQ